MTSPRYPRAAPARRRVLLVGWDAADWQVIDPLLDAGLLPNLARLVERGTIADLATLHPPYSPILWTSIATGKRPTRHGVLGFTEPTPDGRAVRPVTSLSRRCKALWNILGQNGLRSVVTGWYPSHPVEPINGVMVSDLFVKPGDGAEPAPLPPGSVHPPEWRERLDELRIASQEIPAEILAMFVPDMARVDQAKDKRLHMLAHVLAENITAHSAATDVLEHAEWDLACVFYDGIDHLSHGFMAYHPPRLPWVSEDDFARYRHVVGACYRWHDAMLGRLLELAGPDVTTILVSDHGFESGAGRRPELPAEHAGPTEDHRHFGVLAMHGPGIRSDERIYGASLLDIAPTILHLFELPVGQDMDGKVLVSALEDPGPVRRIPSWEEVPGEAGQHPADAVLDPLDAAAALRQLVDLGYVAPQPEDAAKAVEEAELSQHHTLAQAHEDEGRPDLADLAYVRMLALRPHDHRAFAGRVNALLAMGDAAAAAGVLDAFDASAARAAAEARAELDRREAERPGDRIAELDHEAAQREAFERRALAQALEGREGQRRLLRVRVMLAEGRAAEAMAELKGLQDRLAERGGALGPALLAGLYAEAGEAEAALVEADRAIADDAQDFRTRGLRARLHLSAGRADAAVADAAASLGLVYGQPATHALLGEAQRQLGQPEAAAQALRVAVTMAPGLLAAHELLAELYTRPLDQPEAAAWHRAQATRLREGRKVEALDEDSVPALRPGERPVFATRPWRPGGAAPITVVAGLPRSGTSMLMQALAAGGLAPLTDGRRLADEDNPRGYLEYERAIHLAEDKGWLAEARGRAVKLVLALLPHLPPGESYRLVLVQRDLREVLASQARMLQRLGRPGAALRPRALAAQYLAQERMVAELLAARPAIGVLALDHAEVLADPGAAAARMGAFLGDGFDVGAAAAAIDPALRRQRA